MWRRSFVALTLGAALVVATGFAARTLTPPQVSIVDWTGTGEAFGGWSGLEVAEDGLTFRAVGDSASFTTGRLEREEGRLIAVTSAPSRMLQDHDGAMDTYRAEDAEGLAVLQDGTFLVSYEGYHRVWRHAPDGSGAGFLPPAAEFADLPINGSLEALAITSDGTILAVPEQPAEADRFPVYSFRDGRWNQMFNLQRGGFWLAVGADVGPDGRFYLLERVFLGFGFMSRIRRFDLTESDAPLQGETLYLSPPGRHGNLEGIGIWRDSDGHDRAVLVSDDNFLPILRSQVVEIILPQ